MTEIELNNYIKHYLEEDKTHTAIMLTGEWGSGKTYYVENILVPFLKNENKKNRCITISLYGLENISDISKSIYMELRMKALEKNSEVKATGKLIAKTIVKGVAGIFGIDANMSEDDLQNLYSSIDLSDKLLIFEDLERSNIELIKLLGYIKFATQKTVDIFSKMEENYDNDFLKCIYYGIISFSAKIKEGEFPAWQGTEYISTLLGTSWNPLFKFCYDYIRWQKIEVDEISKTRDAYEEMRLYDKKADRSDKDLQKLYSYYERTENEVREVLKNIENRLNDSNDIGFYNYGKLAAYLIRVNHAIEFDYTKCKERMIRNIRGKGDSISSDLLFLPMYDFEG